LDSARLPDVVEGLTSEDVIVADLPSKDGQRVNTARIGRQEEQLASVAASVLYLACNGLDECHDIVLPYSWPMDTDIGGKAVTDSKVKVEASYCHALVHR